MAQKVSELFEATLADITHYLQQLDWPTLPSLPQWVTEFEIPNFPESPDALNFPHVSPWGDLPGVQELLETPFVSQFSSLLDTPQIASWFPIFWGVLATVALWLIIRAPHPFRGPRLRRRDTRRGYQVSLRNDILKSAGYRCESPRFFVWGRCLSEATQVDHIYPWSRGGPTTRTNGQALCAAHNRRKNDTRPTWWYILSLERRRRLYYPIGARVRVQGYPRRKEPRRKRSNRRRTKRVRR